MNSIDDKEKKHRIVEVNSKRKLEKMASNNICMKLSLKKIQKGR